MCDWNEQDPHSHVNPVTRFVRQTQYNWDHAVNVRYQARSCKGRPVKSKKRAFQETGELYLDFSFHV